MKNIFQLVIILVLLFLTAVVPVKAEKGSAGKDQHNIIWITCEDISPYIECYGEDLVKTPNIDQLADEGVKFNKAFTAAGVCAPSRSAIITGMYPMSIGTMHMRTLKTPVSIPMENIPFYSAVVPEEVKCFPEYLRREGYYTTNNEKQDYQFEAPVTAWDENSAAASFENCPEGKPFFSIFNLFITHESQIFRRKDPLRVDPKEVTLPPFYPDNDIIRNDMARLFTNIEMMDDEVGEIIQKLKKDGLYDNSYIFFYSDHGGNLPWMKREVLERGIHIPLIVKFPKGVNAGAENNDLVSAVDFAPTILSLTGIDIPDYMEGQAFLGEQKAKDKRKYVYAGRDRMDTEYDRVRAVRDEQFEYLYNYMPEKPYYQSIDYRLNVPTMKEIIRLKDNGELNNEYTKAWFEPKHIVEELYDVKNDPNELHNLANDPKYKDKLEELRLAFWQWTMKVGDLGALPEQQMVDAWWNGEDHAPTTSKPIVEMTEKGATITCDTKGASIGYKILKNGESDQKIKRIVHSYCLRETIGRVKEGDTIEVDSPWDVYDGKEISLEKGDKLLVKAMRIGYEPSVTEFVF